jgi:polyhydroxyalkanoate synthesis regulator protein
MSKLRPSRQSDPIVLRWYPGSVMGVLWDAELNGHSREELLDWAARGIDFVVIDHTTGADITRVFLAQWNDARTQVIDPVGSRNS